MQQCGAMVMLGEFLDPERDLISVERRVQPNPAGPFLSQPIF
jgi:hypothetical protein